MQEITRIILAVILGMLSAGILFSVFKFIIMNYMKQIKVNENDIKKIDKRIVRVETKLEIKTDEQEGN